MRRNAHQPDITTTAFQTRPDIQDRIRKLQLREGPIESKAKITTISFSSVGDVVLTGSKNSNISLWNTYTGSREYNNENDINANPIGPISHALLLPESNEKKVIASYENGQVLVHTIREGGKFIAREFQGHEGPAGQLALHHSCPTSFYSCGGDGKVYMHDLRSDKSTRIFQTTSLNSMSTGHYISNVIAVGGRGTYAKIYDIRMARAFSTLCPRHLIGSGELVCITNLAFSTRNELLASYAFDSVYLFPDVNSGSEPPKEYAGAANYGNIRGGGFLGPACNYVVSGSDKSHVFVWDKWTGNRMRMLRVTDSISARYVVSISARCVATHPSDLVLASAGEDELIKFWSSAADEELDVYKYLHTALMYVNITKS